MQRLPDVVIFGPQRSLPDPKELSRLRLVILSEPKLVAAIKDLPDLWHALVQALPEFRQVPGPEVFLELKAWIDHGRPLTLLQPCPNVLLTPLSVVADTANYLHRLRLSNSDRGESHAAILGNVRKCGGFQGLCTGLLTGMAIACSRKDSDIGDFAAVALRLALCVGALVDLEGAFAIPPDEACCLGVRSTCREEPTLLKVLQEFPEAYVSVLAGETYRTITISKTAAPMLMQRLSSSSVFLVKVSQTEGRFHTPRHEKNLVSILSVCNTFPGLQFPTVDEQAALDVTILDSHHSANQKLHEYALRSILTEQADWQSTTARATARLGHEETAIVLAIGEAKLLTHALLEDTDARLNISYMQNFEFHDAPILNSMTPRPLTSHRQSSNENFQRTVSDHDIAIIGMACRFPGANSVEEYWQLMCEGNSMHREVPRARFSTQDLGQAEGSQQTFWGNFLDNIEEFDHQFFNKSSLEAASMDPQQRIALQVAYQAIETSGYFDELTKTNTVGCYLGVGSVDYLDNVASHPRTAFTAIGTLRAFISGKISHYFGWTGPSITYDTACSSSAVAIHSACKAIQSGECATALAGGVNIITSPMLYQNLSKAGFLSPSGPCKPFDAQADGYCRGEGVGMLVLKRLSSAIADCDSIAGIIAGSAVSQSDNSSPITVPQSQSQSDLYRRVTSMAGIDPRDVGYVEAHGTGTSVGDPIECESIRQTFGKPQRSDTLYLGSVKSVIGHTEAASGVAAVIRAVLMMQNGTVPMQANFSKLNPKISSLESDHMEIPLLNKSWKGKNVCVNNYGAAGSNAAMIICKAPENQGQQEEQSKLRTPLKKLPLLLSAHSQSSLRAYCAALRHSFANRDRIDDGSRGDIADTAFALAHRSNYSLTTSIATSVNSLSELDALLLEQAESNEPQLPVYSPKKPTTVLCFGGQTKTWIGLSEELFQNILIFRMHLDRCEHICRSLGVKGFYPKVFSKTPIEDMVLLQCMLFSIQYACAKSWIDCALQVDVVIGHSFGQLTALCVSGSISLLQGLQLVKGRATLIKDLCGLEKGKMLSLESDLDTVRKALSMANQNNSQDVEIACFNGPSTHVLVGSKASMEALESKIENETRILGALKARRLDVTHGFHSHLVDPILPGLAELASAIDFHEPRIKVETCSKDRSWTQIDAHSITQHSREPVYFSEAVNRIAKERGPCNWIEAGTDSGITGMVRRALDAPVQTKHSFQPISLTSGNGMDSLTDATVSLWQLGVKVQFWPFHRLQRHRYKRISLPPYQFDKQGHWIEYREPTAIKPTGDQDRTRILNLLSFVSFMRPQNSNQSFAEFIIDPESQAFKTYVQGHKVLGNSSCPASVYIHLISKAVAELLEEDLKKAEGTFCIDQLEMQSPLGLISQRTISLSLESSDHTPGTWSFRICSYDSTETLKVVNHASGVAYLNQAHPHATIPDLQPSSPHTQAGEEASIAGSFIYKIFSTVVEYAEYFKGLQQVSSRGTEVTGLVSLSQISAVLPQIGPDLLCDPLMIDNFLQVAGLYINCLQDNKPGTLYVCTQIQRFQRHLVPGKQQLGPWGVVCHVVSTSAKVIAFDIRASDVQNQSTVVTISGALFTKVSAVSLTRTLSKLRSMKESSSINNDAVSIEDIDDELTKNSLTPEPQNGFEVVAALAEQSVLEKPSFPVKVAQISDNENLCFIRLRELLSSLTEIPVEDMHRKSLLQEIGLDSLMTTEVLGEIEKAFEISITMSEFDKIKDLGCLSSHIESKDPQRFGAVVAPPEPVIKSNVTRSLKESDTLKTPGGDRNTENTAISRDCIDGKEGATAAGEKTSMSSDTAVPSPKVLECFEAAREDFSCVLDETQLTGFTKSVFPGQSKLVEAYVVEAFENLGCSLSQIQEGDSVSVTSVTQYTPLMKQLHQILQRSSLIHCYESGSVRSGAPISEPPAYDILQKLLESFPQHASEHHLLGAMGPHLANFISGKEDPIQLLFGSKATKDLLTDVYSNAPMFATGTRLLANFLLKSIATKILPTKIRILEIGGGVCGTTASIIELLESTGHPFTYTFTDISPSFVAAAKTRFASHGSMEFRVLDIEATPPSFLLRSQDVVIATNVVHATKSLKESCTNIRKMLDKDGMLCLVELTTNLYWFDLVFGLLDGWWRFEDGRKHAIADVEYWERSLHEAEFEQVVWTGDGSEEGDLIRLMVAFAPNEGMKPEQCATEKALMTMETIMFRKVDRIPLYADIYHPHTVQKAKSKRPIALLIHGGGHVMLSRKDIRPFQLQHLLSSGLLPISIDHRLCPEVSLISGPMTDICYALDWARNVLPTLPLQRSDVDADGTRVVVIGWSTGGMLAMSLAWTAPARGLKPPEAVLAFYCPTDYESEWWKTPHFPWRTSQADAMRQYDLWEAVRATPITGYNIASARAPGGWMSTLDVRARVPLHMNWTAQTLPILLGALTSEKKMQREDFSRGKPSSQQQPHNGHSRLAQPPAADVKAISPLAQIRAGNYSTPTYLIHGSEDDFISWEETQRTYDELVKRGVPAGVSIVEGGGHMFEMLGVPGNDERVWQTVLDGYRFIFERVGLI